MKHLNKNNKGFSLVELLISVAILAVVALPLLQVFTLSAKLTGKARVSGEATAAAQNIQETIEARGVANILNQNTDGTVKDSVALSMFGNVDQADTSFEGDSTVVLRSLSVGDKKFDARVLFDPIGSEKAIYEDKYGNSINRSIYTINGKSIAQYTDMSGTFSQSFVSSQNPDDIAGQDFSLAHPDGTPTTRKRTVIVDVTSADDPNGGYLVYVDVTFSYAYTYKTGSATGLKDTINEVYNIFPSGKHIDDYNTEVACFLMYYAFYEYNGTENFTINIDRYNENSDLQFKLFLVKQIPMVKNSEDRYVNVLDPTAGTAGSRILTKDRKYAFAISEFHNTRYQITTDAAGRPTDEMMNVYTNANRQLENRNLEVTGAYSYKIKSPHSSGYFYFYKESILRNQLVRTEVENRFYNVTISIYDEGKADEEDARPVYTMQANKLK